MDDKMRPLRIVAPAFVALEHLVLAASRLGHLRGEHADRLPVEVAHELIGIDRPLVVALGQLFVIANQFTFEFRRISHEWLTSART